MLHPSETRDKAHHKVTASESTQFAVYSFWTSKNGCTTVNAANVFSQANNHFGQVKNNFCNKTMTTRQQQFLVGKYPVVVIIIIIIIIIIYTAFLRFTIIILAAVWAIHCNDCEWMKTQRKSVSLRVFNKVALTMRSSYVSHTFPLKVSSSIFRV